MVSLKDKALAEKKKRLVEKARKEKERRSVGVGEGIKVGVQRGLPFGEELVAGLASLGGLISNDAPIEKGSFAKSFSEELSKTQARGEVVSEARPILTGSVSAATTLGSALIPGLGAAKGAGLLRAAGKGALVGGAFGAEESRSLEGGLLGAGLGGALGGLGGALGKFSSKASREGEPLISKLTNQVEGKSLPAKFRGKENFELIERGAKRAKKAGIDLEGDVGVAHARVKESLSQANEDVAKLIKEVDGSLPIIKSAQDIRGKRETLAEFIDSFKRNVSTSAFVKGDKVFIKSLDDLERTIQKEGVSTSQILKHAKELEESLKTKDFLEASTTVKNGMTNLSGLLRESVKKRGDQAGLGEVLREGIDAQREFLALSNATKVGEETARGLRGANEGVINNALNKLGGIQSLPQAAVKFGLRPAVDSIRAILRGTGQSASSLRNVIGPTIYKSFSEGRLSDPVDIELAKRNGRANMKKSPAEHAAYDHKLNTTGEVDLNETPDVTLNKILKLPDVEEILKGEVNSNPLGRNLGL